MPRIYHYLRSRLLPLFRRFNLGDITIRHHHTGDRIRLHSFRHKGYWFHGRQHQSRSLGLLQALARMGDAVLDVGGHIGYTGVYLAKLVGPTGKVYVFEPGPNNLKYLRQNAAQHLNVEVVAAAASDRAGRQTLYVEDLTGQNNSFIADYGELRKNAAAARVAPRVEAVDVPTVTLDEFCAARRIVPQLVKVDVEGAELNVLEGMRQICLTARPLTLLEVAAGNRPAAWKWLAALQYAPLDDAGRAVPDPAAVREDDVVCVPLERVAEVSRRLAERQAACSRN